MEENKEGKSECEKFLQLLSLLLDNEASQQETAYLSDHMEECSPCLQQLELEKQLRQMLKNQLEHREVPLELIDSIKSKIKSLA